MHIPARRRLVAVGVLTAAAVAIAATLAIVTGPSTPQAAPATGDLPSVLQRHLATMPGNFGMSDEGPGGAADWAFASRAFPADTISVAQMDTARSSFSTMSKRPFKGARGQPGVWMSIGPSKAVYPLEASATPPTTCRTSTSRAAARRRSRSTSHLHAAATAPCTSPPPAAASGARRTRSPGNVELGVPGRPARASTPQARSRSTRTTRAATPSTSAPARPTSAAPAVWPAPALQVDQRRRHLDGPLGKPSSQGKGIGEILVKPGDPNTIYVGDDDRAARHVVVCCSGVTRPVPGAAKWGLYKSTTAARRWTFIHNGSANAADCTGDLTEFNNGDAARRAASATSRSTRRTPTSSTRPRTHAASGARTTPARRGRRSSRR